MLYQLVLLKNANLDLVNTVISSIPSNDDVIILVLGALARNSNIKIQKIVVDELLRRLNKVLSSSNTEAMSIVIYALGNTGSKTAIFPLLSILQYDDIDIQIAAIRSLGSHLDEPIVQKGIINSLQLTDEDKILEEILKILINAFENMILTNPSKEMINALINSAIQTKNPNLYELLAKYLHQVNTDEVDIYIDLLKQQHNYGDLQREVISDVHTNESRVKRGSDWDQYYSDYDVVASYSQRRSDVTNYPNHRAYIWGKTFGVDKLNMKVGVGAFAGIYINPTIVRFKFYAKAVAKVNVFGKTINVVDIEMSGYTSGQILHYKHYLKQGNSVDRNDNKMIKLGLEYKNDVASIAKSREIFYMRWPIFIYVGTLNVYIRGTLTSRMDISLSANMLLLPPAVNCSIDTKLSLDLRVTGGAYASLLVIYFSSY